ncbi:MAG: hypothetical protein ACP5OP_05680 [Leptospirillia bacterium]
MSVDYVGKTREFIAHSTAEIRRLEREIDMIREIVVRLERYIDEGNRSSTIIRRNLPDTPPSSPSFLSSENVESPSPFSSIHPEPSMKRRKEERQAQDEGSDDLGRTPGRLLRPVGEVAEELLKERRDGMSLDELYRVMAGRTDIPASRDLKNAIRVSLIRRKPQVVSPRRGWFRWVSSGE